MKINRLIVILMLLIQMHNLGAMAAHKETVKRLSELASTDGKDERKEGHSALATISLDSPRNKRKFGEPVDPITCRTQQAIIEQQQVNKFNIFFQEFKKQTDIVWQNRAEINHKIILEHVKSVDQKDFDTNKRTHALEAQVKIDAYYVQQYKALYQKLYQKHYKSETPEEVAKHFAAQRYSNQKSEECCVIL